MNTKDLISRLTANAQRIRAAVTTQVVGALRVVVMSVGSLTLLLCTSLTLAIVSLCLLPPVLVIARCLGADCVISRQRFELWRRCADASNIAEEAFQVIKTVRQFAAEQHKVERYSTAIQKARAKAIKAETAQAAFDGTVHVAANAAILGVLGRDSR